MTLAGLDIRPIACRTMSSHHLAAIGKKVFDIQLPHGE